jgi:uncharacterized damage-inducible protein DinB
MDLPIMKNRACLALAEETEAARQALYALLPRFPQEAFISGNVDTEDNVRGILCHVTFAILSYGLWIERVLERVDPALEKERKVTFLARVRSLSSAAEFEDASREASEVYYRALAGTSVEELDLEFKTNWGGIMGIEGMMEHALVHLLRHRRQLQIHLGLRPAGEIQA